MKVINTFLVKLFALILTYFFIDNFLAKNVAFIGNAWNFLFEFLMTSIVRMSSYILENIFNFSVINSKSSIMIEGSIGVIVGYPCIGVGLTFSFVSLVIAYPGKFKNKLRLLPIGILGIFLLNIVRVIYLVLLVNKNSELDIYNQHDLFNFIIYTFVFLLWMIWVHFENKEKKNLSAPTAPSA